MQKLFQSLILAKQEFKPIIKDGYNPHYKSKYATLENVLEAISPALNKYNLCLIQPPEIRENRTILKTIIYHCESGESLSAELLLPDNLDPQKMGSAISYYRRYAICSLLSIVADDDDDANITITQQITTTAKPTQPKAAPTKRADEGEAKARAIFSVMRGLGLSKDDVLKMSINRFKTDNIRSLSWKQIEQLKIDMDTVAHGLQPV